MQKKIRFSVNERIGLRGEASSSIPVLLFSFVSHRRHVRAVQSRGLPASGRSQTTLYSGFRLTAFL
jgi:hypothetical protein